MRAPGPERGCPLEPSPLRPARRGVSASRLRGLVRGTGGTVLVCAWWLEGAQGLARWTGDLGKYIATAGGEAAQR